MKLVDNAKQFYRWFSVQAIAACAAIQGAMLAFPGALQQYVPDRVMHAIALVVLAGAIFGRLIQQGKPNA